MTEKEVIFNIINRFDCYHEWRDDDILYVDVGNADFISFKFDNDGNVSELNQ